MKKFTYGLFTAGALCVAGFAATAMPAEARDRGQTNFSVSLGHVQFGYSDGYYDNGRRWHRWRNDRERNWYQQNYRQSYYHMRRDHDRDRNRRNWRDGHRNDWRGNRH